MRRRLKLKHARRSTTDRSPKSKACTHFSTAKLPTRRFFSKSSALWDGIKVFIVETLPAAFTEGPFIGGVRPGVDDFHVGAWIARIAFVSGAQKSEGWSALEKIFGPLPENVKAYWTAWIGRDSWVKAYPENVLH